eukprot:jgi/Orpsp1_1/1185878/evm.model.c7180000095786.1
MVFFMMVKFTLFQPKEDVLWNIMVLMMLLDISIMVLPLLFLPWELLMVLLKKPIFIV